MTDVPIATYRVQLSPDFGFQQVADLADYLAHLGISHLYPSPYLQTAPNSPNPYAVVDSHRVSDELGGPEAHATMVQALEQHSLAQLLDIVPNHMAADAERNPWWNDILARGTASRYAQYFDIDWEAPEVRVRQKVLLPVLADPVGRLMESGKLKLLRADTQFYIGYLATPFPVAPESLAPLLKQAAELASSDALHFIADMLGRLPNSDTRNVGVLLAQLDHLLTEQPEIIPSIDQVLAKWNVDPDLLDQVVRAQHYRLAWWRTGIHELNYRRFFNIDTLVGLCVEQENVFHDVHALVLQWLSEGSITALRIDHIDGLRDPEKYLRQIRQEAPTAWVLVEKILVDPERLPESWPVAGTTGYDFLTRVAGLFIDPAGEKALTQIYADFTGSSKNYEQWLRETKGLVLSEMFGGELNRLAHLFYSLCDHHRLYRDFTYYEIHLALHATIVAFPVYRAYARPETATVSDHDSQVTSAAIEAAKSLQPDLDPRLLDFLRDILLLRVRGRQEDDFVLRFQQLTGPVMAKGLEDTAFYCYNRLISLNEVGGRPDQFGCSPKQFHQRCQETQQLWPQT